tara:strand:+ start:59 stop:958 length:900 start_codon:yes stop_codon:yes gene_type:complete
VANLLNVHGQWVNTEKPGGQVFFVGGGTVAVNGKAASDTNNGLTPQQPLSTIDGSAGAFAKVKAGRGDTIVLLPGNVTISTAIAFDTDDVTLTGFPNQGNVNSSSITVNAAIDGINVTGANAIIENLHFPAGTSYTNTSRIDAGAAGLTVRDCTFECGAYDLETITIPAAGLHTTIEGCRFYVTANNPDAAIEIENAAAHFITIRNNVFHGGNNTNAWDGAAINSGVAHLDCLIDGNINTDGNAIKFTAAATGMISRNLMGLGTLGSMLDPGSCACAENYEADAINETARIFPTSAAAA